MYSDINISHDDPVQTCIFLYTYIDLIEKK